MALLLGAPSLINMAPDVATIRSLYEITYMDKLLWDSYSKLQRSKLLSFGELPPEFILEHWKTFNTTERMKAALFQRVPETILSQLWNKLDSYEQLQFCSHTDVSKEFLVQHWSTMAPGTKIECLLNKRLIETFEREEMVMFLVDSSATIRIAASQHMKQSVLYKLIRKIRTCLCRSKKK